MRFAKLAGLAAGLLVAGTALVSVLALQQIRRAIEALETDRRITETRHGRMAYVTWGQGPPVLVIHGAGGGFDQGRLLARQLGGHGFHWIAISRFGYLGSELPANPSPTVQAEAVADLLDTLNIECSSVLAMSGGVPPALKFAELYPGRTRRMVLLSSAPFTPFGADIEERPVPTWLYEVLLGNDVLYWILTKAARPVLAEAFDARAELRQHLPPAEQAFLDALIDTFIPSSRRIAGIKNEGAAVDARVTYDLESLERPVIVVHARDDRLNPFEIGATIARRVDSARLLPLDTGGHLLLGHHAELRNRIRTFLASDEWGNCPDVRHKNR